ncbi:MAG: hypothetical protein AAGG46_05410 [Planctomycetota bacterium]
MKICLVSTDLMASSQLEGAAASAGAALVTCSPATAVASVASEAPAMVVIDLTAGVEDLPAIVAAAAGQPVVAYGPHVHEKRLAAARDAGCTEVFTRGQFYRSAAAVFARCSAG